MATIKDNVAYTYNNGTWKTVCNIVGESWSSTTTVMNVNGVGCLVKVSTTYKSSISESVTWVPDVLPYHFGVKDVGKK